MKVRSIITAMIALFFINNVLADTFSKEISETRLSEAPFISDIIIHAYNENPLIRAAHDNWRAAVENYRAATGYPDPQVMITYFPVIVRSVYIFRFSGPA